MNVTHGSLFSGIGGFDLASEKMGWDNLFHCEWNPFCQKILHYYWPKAEQFTDITKTDFTKYANKIDVLTGGFPCQPYSTAGKRFGKDDERHLWPSMLRAIKELNQVGSWAKMFTELLIGQGDWSSTRCKLTWKMKGTKYNRIYFQLAPKTLPTAEIESGLLLTPTAVMTDEHPDAMRARAKKNGYKNGTMYGSLLSQVKYSGLFPTPTSVQRDHPERVEKLKATGAKTMMSRKAGENRPNSILDAAMFTGMIPTPNSQRLQGHFQKPRKAKQPIQKKNRVQV